MAVQRDSTASPEIASAVLDALFDAPRDIDKPPLTQLRRAAGVTAKDLSAALFVAPRALAMWESGERRPTPTHRAAYEAALTRMAAVVRIESLSPAAQEICQTLRANSARAAL